MAISETQEYVRQGGDEFVPISHCFPEHVVEPVVPTEYTWEILVGLQGRTNQLFELRHEESPATQATTSNLDICENASHSGLTHDSVDSSLTYAGE